MKDAQCVIIAQMPRVEVCSKTVLLIILLLHHLYKDFPDMIYFISKKFLLKVSASWLLLQNETCLFLSFTFAQPYNVANSRLQYLNREVNRSSVIGRIKQNFLLASEMIVKLHMMMNYNISERQKILYYRLKAQENPIYFLLLICEQHRIDYIKLSRNILSSDLYLQNVNI